VTALVQRRDYLVDQRRSIIARSVLGSIAGALPIPFFDDWAVTKIVGNGYKNIASSHQVDVSADAITKLVYGTTPPPSVVELAASGIVYQIASRTARRMMLAVATVKRARSAARTFVAMTLFDHYCARLHRGLALDATTALALRDEITRSIDNTPGALAFHPFRRGALSAARATLRAPLELADIASRGALRRLLARRSEVTEAEHVDELEQAMEAALADKGGFLARTVAAIEVQLSAEANPFLDAAIESLDRRWRARIAAESDS
jgi:hypothetical protein